jgi:hypothetical protein
MNKFTKYAIDKLNAEKSRERDAIVKHAFKCTEFRSAQRKQKYGLSEKTRDQSAVCYSIKHTMELATVNGLKKCYGNYDIDRLAVGDFQLPIPRFYYCTNGNCYRPGFKTYQFNEIIGRYHYKSFKKKVVMKWAKVKASLLQPIYKKGGSLMKPILVIDHGDHVYFINDVKAGEIKIGVSKQLMTRFHTFNQGIKGTRLQVLKIIDIGGYDLEAALHKFFGKHRLGRTEWFVDHKDIRDFITELDAGADPWELIKAGQKVRRQEEQAVA